MMNVPEAERLLPSLPLAEHIEPQVFSDYQAVLLGRDTRNQPTVQYKFYCSILDEAIARGSTELADKAYDGFAALDEHPAADLTLPPFVNVRCALAYEEAMRSRVARLLPAQQIRAVTYRNLTKVLNDTLTYPDMAEDRRFGYVGESLVINGLLRAKRGMFPYYSVAREEANSYNALGNHNFYTLKENSYNQGKQPWQVMIHPSTDLPSIDPVEDIFVVPLVEKAFRRHYRLKQRADAGRLADVSLHHARIRSIANLMIREAHDNDLTPKETALLGDFTGAVTLYISRLQAFASQKEQGDTVLSEALRLAGLVE